MSYRLSHNDDKLPYEFERTGTTTFSLNRRGDAFFTTRLEIIRTFDEEEMVRIGQKVTISRYNLISKKYHIFLLDFLFDETTGNLLDYYVLSDDVGVLITFNADSRCVTQYMVQLTNKFGTIFDRLSGKGVALTICERRKTVNGLQHSISIGLGLLPHGQILICGVRAPGLTANRRSEVTEIEAHLIAANPLHSGALPDKDLTEQMYKLSSLVEGGNSDEKLWTLAPFVDRKGIYLFITKTDRMHGNSHNLVTGRIAHLEFRENGTFAVIILTVDDRIVELPKYPHISVNDLLPPSHSGRTVYLPMLVPNYEQMMSYRFRIYHSVFYYTIVLMHNTLRMCIWLSRWDRGLTSMLFVKTMCWIFGESMLPNFQIPTKYYLYSLNLSERRYGRIPYKNNVNLNPLRTPVIDSCENGVFLMGDLPYYENEIQVGLKMKTALDPYQIPKLSNLTSRIVLSKLGPFGRDPLLRRRFGIQTFSAL